MPELPDATVYVERLEALTRSAVLRRVRVAKPFLLRTVEPPLSAAEGRRVRGVRRLGKRIVLGLDGGLFLVLHLMIAGRLKWAAPGAKPPGRIGLAAFDFEADESGGLGDDGSASGTLLLTEAGSTRRASLHLVQGEAALAGLHRGGLEPLLATPADFAAALRRENHTLKRALTDPRLVSGIGNAYSDEILHRARLSPLQTTAHLDDEEAARLHAATVAVLTEWTVRLRREAAEQAAAGRLLPEKVTAFREGMAVHGRYGQPCPVCGSPVQRILYAETECDYCARCQTGGRVLADRVLSRLLKDDWPRTLEELEERDSGTGGARGERGRSR
jgi:formamidopyrimidine-DNA glycosylase